ncbi:uncharacterized protein LOC143845645 isoform X2 [Tasmannia lanceolata]|uniref:uncharacterized protein LOC143845645 isoform X2 n=1 Tax=Tasmannia lanceolata TaxID=3420 RepID=UPI004062B940
MEFFHKAKAVRLRSHHDKYLLAEDDEESVCQDRNGSSSSTRWTVEFVKDSNVVRLKSCYNKYLTASKVAFLLGMTGKKVLQTLPTRLDSSIEWEPIRDGFHVKLKTRYGQFLRANGGLPPWRNSVTHDIPHRTATQDWVLWEVDIVEIQVGSPLPSPSSVASGSASESPSPEVPSRSTSEHMSPRLSKVESSISFTGSPGSTPLRASGRTIHFSVADDDGNIEEAIDLPSFTFNGNSLFELIQKLEEETGLNDIVVCSRSPFNGKLYPLRLQLPPNNMAMHVVVVLSSSKGKT